jgi:menaquinol-cytochrome c reductase cytochrome b/c subunit
MATTPPQPRFREDVRVSRSPAAHDPAEKVWSWPHLLSIELVTALLYTVALSILAILVNAPLEEMANPDLTPNPSKAPWYFLGLQDLLEHMNPSLAGVIVPSAVLVGLALIPYIDRDRTGIATWYSTEKGQRRGINIVLWTVVYTVLWIVPLELFDNWVGVRPLLENFTSAAGQTLLHQCSALYANGTWSTITECGALMVRHTLGIPNGFSMSQLISEWIIPIAYMVSIPWTCLFVLKWRFGERKLSRREIMLCLFTYMITTYWVLIVFGTGFRGLGMKLAWPWQIPTPPMF